MSLTKAGLFGARVVGQVDFKYLLLQWHDVLVAADQHAVDERVRLEAPVHRRGELGRARVEGDAQGAHDHGITN